MLGSFHHSVTQHFDMNLQTLEKGCQPNAQLANNIDDPCYTSIQLLEI